MHEPGGHPAGAELGRALHHLGQQGGRPRGALVLGQVGIIRLDDVVDQLLDQVRAGMEGVSLESAEADVGGRKPGQHAGARGAGLVGALELLAGLH